MMFVTSKHVFEIKKCHNFLKDNDLLSAVSTFCIQMSMNAAPGSMIAMKMQLVQIQLQTSTAHASQALLEMDGHVQVQ